MTILIIRLSALGDVAMTIPAIYCFADQHPDYKIKVLTSARFCQLFVKKPYNVELMPVDIRELRTFKGFIHLMVRLSAEKIDKVADLHNVLRSWLIDAAFIMTGRRVAMVDKRRRKRESIVCHKTLSAKPFTERYFDVFRRLGFTVEDNFVGLYSAQRSNHTQRVGVAPFARYLNKTYPIEAMHEVVSRLAASGIEIFVFGYGEHEAMVAERWSGESPNIHSLVGKNDLSGDLELMTTLDVIVSMDSANMHLASLVNTPVVSIWGATTPTCGFLGWHQSPKNALCANVDCQPCSISGGPSCPRGDFACMRNIKPEMIINKVVEVINQSR